MPETRQARNFGIDGKELEPTLYEVSDEELAEETEVRELEGIESLVDSAKDVKQLRALLGKVVRRLVKKGILP